MSLSVIIERVSGRIRGVGRGRVMRSRGGGRGGLVGALWAGGAGLSRDFRAVGLPAPRFAAAAALSLSVIMGGVSGRIGGGGRGWRGGTDRSGLCARFG